MRRARMAVVAALVAGLSSPVAAQAEPVTGPDGEVRTITLITGDKVVVDGRGSPVGVDGRPGAQFVQYVRDEHQYVIPADALDDVEQDRLDRRFFDVTALLEFGYDDARTDRVPLLGGGLALAENAVPKAEAARWWARRGTATLGAQKLWLDGKAKLALAESVPMVGAPAAWQAGYDGTGVTVAVLDTGYDQEHPELKDAVAVSRDFTGVGIQDDIGHGTHVAATVAGRSDRYHGVAKGAKLAVGRVCAQDGCPESAIIAGMEWAVREVGAKVVNLSLGGDQSDGTDPLSQAVDRLTAETGALFVVAAGNAGDRRRVSAPAAADEALAVANLTKQGALNEWSSHGPRFGDHAVKPDLAAPGTDIVAARAKGTLPGEAVDDLHARLTGTSMAAPHVAGAAAVLAQRHPSWTARELKAQLMATAKPVADTSDHVGTGLLDVGRAVAQQVRADVGSLSFGLLEWPHTKTAEKTVTYRNDGDQPVTLTLTHDLGQDFTVQSTVDVPAHGTAPVVVTLDPRKGDGTFFGTLKATADGVAVTTAVGAYVQEERHALTAKVIGRDGGAPRDGFLLAVDLKTGQGSLITLDADGNGTAKLPVSDYAVLSRINQPSALPGWYTPVSMTDVVGRVSTAQDVSVTLDAREAKPITVALDDPAVRQLHRYADILVPLTPGKVSGVSGPVQGSVPVYGLSFGDPLPQLDYRTLVKAAQPRVSLAEFPVLLRYFGGSPYFTPGKHRLRTARPDGDVTGALVVADGTGESEYELAQRMKDAGAAAVVVLGPQGLPWNDQTALPVLSAADYEAADLVAHIGREVTVEAVDTAPVSYHLFFPEHGTLPAGKTYAVRKADLAEVKAQYRSSGADGAVGQRVYPTRDGRIVAGMPILDEVVVAPAARTEYYSAGDGIGWYHEESVGRMFGTDARDPNVGTWSDYEPVVMQPGGRYRRDWNPAVTAPRLRGTSLVQWAAGGGVTRVGDAIEAKVSPFATRSAVESWRRTGVGALELKRDGVTLGSSGNPWQGRWSVPAEQGRYELTLSAGRSAPQVELSSNVSTTWGFTSTGGTAGALPLLEVDYTVPLDIRNSAKAGLPLPVRFTAQRQAGAGKAKIRDLKAFASFDDGATWVPVRTLIPRGGKPGGYVSLRVTASDTEGNTVDQTVLRAYRLRA
ncbi:S8 family serine peptidase [Saccharothrix variisporea]|uniref:Subtilase family protein n=1 Tax=Saccharothrix variisporea TaxID=543527 RepID=A0A495X7R8_9PSEU|nr:S8 family serine peptidase [Saccharothrix variisporea]RKT67568.1 subtilase family protein [Saccharothrix variisporea]